MPKPKNTILLFIVLVFGFLSYYFFKGYNHKITFKTNLSPSVVKDYLVSWENYKNPEDSVVIVQKDKDLYNLELDYHVKDSILKMDWNFNRKNDSITVVSAKITDKANPILANFHVINPRSIFYKTNVSIVEKVARSLNEYKKSFKLGTVTTDTIPSKYCVYLNVSSSVKNKAQSMLNSISPIMGYIKKNNIQLDGNPFLEVTNWDIQKNALSYDFCFPIKKNDSLPAPNNLMFKQTKEKNALKVIFNGNYRDSHRAWLTLIDYAYDNNIKTEQHPTEFFLNDPHSGTNSLEWQAEVYMPIK